MDLGVIAMKGVLCITQSSSITEASSDCLVSYPGHLLGESYLSAEMQSVYSAAAADWLSYSGDSLYTVEFGNR